MQNIFRTLTLATVVVFAATATASAQYTFDFEKGGWVDEDAGLVWGYNAVCINGSLNNDWNSSDLFAANYPFCLFANGLDEEADVAARFEGWRLPTIDEADAAWVKGLFALNRDPFLDPLDFCDPRLDRVRWTSSGRGTRAFAIRPSTGEVLFIRKVSWGVSLVVRSINPGADGGGNGNGNGKGKNK